MAGKQPDCDVTLEFATGSPLSETQQAIQRAIVEAIAKFGPKYVSYRAYKYHGDRSDLIPLYKPPPRPRRARRAKAAK